jgi:toxin-antitoxin system, toxin component, PIN family
MLSEVTIAGLYNDVYNTKQQKYFKGIHDLEGLFEVFSVSDAVSLFGRNKAMLRQRGFVIENFDLLIGSIAVTDDCILVTDKVGHLGRIPDVKIENWIST